MQAHLEPTAARVPCDPVLILGEVTNSITAVGCTDTTIEITHTLCYRTQ